MNAPVVLVLASGRGERFIASGGTTPKLQALLGGQPVLERTLDAVRASGLPWHVEDAGHAGMGDCIAAAVGATRDAPGWLVLPGDLPLVLPDTLRAVAAGLARKPVVVPHYRGQRGHPVAFGASCGEALCLLQGAQGAAPVLRAHAAMDDVEELELDDPNVTERLENELGSLETERDGEVGRDELGHTTDRRRLCPHVGGDDKMRECRRPRSLRCRWPSCSSRASAGLSASMSSTTRTPACSLTRA